MVDVARRRATYAEYVAMANDSDVKYDYFAGEVVAMAGGAVEHGRLIARATALLDRALEGRPCIVLPSGIRIRIRDANRSTYAALHIVCGRPERDPDDDHAIVNPTVIVEVLSDSTAGFDRIEKFAAYRRLPSLREYVLLSQRERRAEVYRRRENRRWELDEHLAGDQLRLESVAIELSIDDLYVDRVGVIVP